MKRSVLGSFLWLGVAATGAGACTTILGGFDYNGMTSGTGGATGTGGTSTSASATTGTGGSPMPSCTDGKQDGDETDVDCGGSCPMGCGLGKGCKSVTDCQNGPNGMQTCFNNKCGFTCATGFADCDTMVGCETDITKPAHCGSCNNTCGSICQNGMCNDPTQLAGGYEHFCALLKDGTVECWGYNDVGELGDGTTTTRPTPVKVPLGKPAKQVSAGGLYTANPPDTVHSCAVLTDNSVSCWGSNDNGELGLGDTSPHTGPQNLVLGNSIASVSGHGGHICALDLFGKLYCWGLNSHGQVGNGSPPNAVTTPTVVLPSGVLKVSAGGSHTCVIKNDNNLYCWGWNAFGQLGDGTLNTTTAPPATPKPASLSNVIDVQATRRSTCALVQGGDVYCWGFNGGGEVGEGTTADGGLPGQICSGLPCEPTPVKVATLGGATQIAMGQDHVGALTPGGLYMWGTDNYGELGDNQTVNDVPSPELISAVPALSQVALAYVTSCGLTPGGAVWCWGEDAYGECGDGTMGPTNNLLVPKQITAWP